MHQGPVYEKLVPGGGSEVELQPDSSLTTKRSRLANVLDLDASVLRGVTLPDLLAGGGRLFADHGVCARIDPTGTYALSQPVQSLSFFVSHAWKTPRFAKYLAFLMHFNSIRASMVATVVTFMVFWVELFFSDTLPTWA